MLDKIITYSFYLLFFITPLFWSSLNYELFEYNKMLLVYGFTIIITGSWLLKIINHKSLIINRTPLDIPLLLFLGANILSTVFSIDTHTSIWGYYSRSNGGLLSLISYLLLYWAFVSNMDKEKVLNTLKFGLASGFLISLWAISEHFGVSPSCVILRGEFNASCWVQDVQARVFATLGQPNWLAVYLSMLIFPALYFLLTATNTKERIIYYISLLIMYSAFTFTYSRGPTLGLIVGILIFLGVVFLIPILNQVQKNGKRQLFELLGTICLTAIWGFFTDLPTGNLFRFIGRIIFMVLIYVTFNIFIRYRQSFLRSIKLLPNFKHLLLILVAFIFINTLFGSALTSFRLVSRFAPPPRPAVALPPTNVTQLENGGTESGQIRFIVWQGALDIFKAYPIFGSGLETFAYSYYQYRPASHNLTSEWDFLYNKAHNEYLNYLSTTGITGLGSYSIIIITFVIFILKKQRFKNLLLVSLLASYVSYLVYNFFLFSVVIIAIFFYLFPALAFVATDSTKPLNLKILFFKRSIYIKFAKGLCFFFTLYLLFSIYKLWYADTLFNQAEQAQDSGNPGRAYNLLRFASGLNSSEPFYRSELAYSAAAASNALKDTDATSSGLLKDEATAQTVSVLKSNPNNVSFWRTSIRTYFELGNLDEALRALDQTIKLAPTDPKLYYNKALILDSQNKKPAAIEALKKALELKPNYLEAKKELDEIH